MKKLLRLSVTIALFVPILSSCSDTLNSDQFEKNRVNADDFFSFNTTRQVTLCLDYGQAGAYALVRLYDNNPLVYDEQEGRYMLNEELAPLHQQFTDSTGCVFTKVSIPVHVSQDVWIYSDYMALPQCEHCLIENGVIFNFRHVDNPDFTKAGISRAVVSNPEMFKINEGFHTIVKWSNKYGKPNDSNGIYSSSSLTSDDMAAAAKAVWSGNTSRPSYFDNSSYTVKSTELTNTKVPATYYDGQGKIQSLESAQVFLDFVMENSWNENVIGYYFYPSDNVPQSPDKVKKYVILPNTSVAGNPPYGVQGFNNLDWGYYNAPVSQNSRIQLLYEDEQGKLTPNFPPNTTIGYFVITDGWAANGGSTSFDSGSTTKSALTTRAVNKNVYIKAGETGTIELDDYYTNVEWSQTNYNCAAVNPQNNNGYTKTAYVYTWAKGEVTITAFRTIWDSWGNSTRVTLGTFNVFVNDTGTGPASGGETQEGKIDFSKPTFYSNKEWNSDGAGHFINFNYNGYVIYGVEDSDDKAFDDFVFMVSSNPASAIVNSLNPDVINGGYDDPNPTALLHDIATYCYEDIWPYVGDYDLNDVVIEHRSSVCFDRFNNVTQVIDSFTVCNDRYSSGEGVSDAFAIRIPLDQRGSIINLPAGAVNETETSSIIIFENAQDNIGELFVIARYFDQGSLSLKDLTRGLDLDPYIIPVMPDESITCYDSHRREVHFPKKEGTSKIESVYYINDTEAFFVARDNRHPFAISIPLRTAQTADEIAQAKKDGSMFIVAPEMSEIDGQYAKSGHSFAEWVESEGKTCTDWYRYYSPRSGESIRTEMKKR